MLILDGVLAAGDIFFRQKCYARLEELLAKGTTIILVSHMIPMIQHYSSNVLVLHHGEQVYHGEAKRGVSVFMTLQRNQSPKLAKDTFQHEESDLKLSLPHSSQDHFRTYWPPEKAFTYTSFPKLKGGGSAQLTRLAICNEQGTPCQAFKQGERAYLYYEYQLKEDIGVPITTIDIFNEFNVLIHNKNSLQSDVETPQRVPQGEYLRLSHSFTLGVAPGNYIFNLRLSAMHPDDYARLGELPEERPHEKMAHLCGVAQAGFLVVMPHYGAKAMYLHGGLCDLPGDCHIQLVSSAHNSSDSPVASYQGSGEE